MYTVYYYQPSPLWRHWPNRFEKLQAPKNKCAAWVNKIDL